MIPDDLAHAIRAAPVVLGTTVDEVLDVLADPPPWETGHATAIAWVLDRGAEHVLLVRHRLHGWSCPGGHVEPGEDPRIAAARELAEETGLTLPAAGVLTLTGSLGCARAAGARHWAIGVRFTAELPGPLRAEPDQDAAWWPRTALPSPRAADVDVVIGALVGTPPADRRS